MGLLLLAALIIVSAYALAAVGRSASLPANIGPFLAMLLGLFVIGHLAVRRLAPWADGLVLPLAGLLNGLGYVFIARMNERLAAAQATWSAVGMAGFVVTLVLVRRARSLERYRYSFAALGILLLLLPSMPFIGREINGARFQALETAHFMATQTPDLVADAMLAFLDEVGA